MVALLWVVEVLVVVVAKLALVVGEWVQVEMAEV